MSSDQTPQNRNRGGDDSYNPRLQQQTSQIPSTGPDQGQQRERSQEQELDHEHQQAQQHLHQFQQSNLTPSTTAFPSSTSIPTFSKQDQGYHNQFSSPQSSYRKIGNFAQSSNAPFLNEPHPIYATNYQQNVPLQSQFQFDYSSPYIGQSQSQSQSQSQAQPQPHPQPQTYQQLPHYSQASVSLLPPTYQAFHSMHEASSADNDSATNITTPQKRKKQKRLESVASNTGENELKQLALRSSNIPLSELAQKVKQLENDSTTTSVSLEQSKMKENKETQRQLFGMVWLLNSCDLAPTAVIPRNRIYARYVQVCADNNLAPVSPASFGKLVKILYPNITTRRLGMRGQSKYHYCGIKLTGDENMQLQLLNYQQKQKHQSQEQYNQQAQVGSSTSLAGLAGHQSPMSSCNSSVSYEESPGPIISRAHTPSFSPINTPTISMSKSLNDQLPLILHMKFIPNLFYLLNSNVATSSNPHEPIQLPSIYPYLSKDADHDIADTLYSLYKVHVNSIFEALRYMQLKKLFSSFSTFNNILTAPVLKLYTTESLAEWVMKCDLIMYKKMIRMLSKLQLQLLIPQEQLLQLKQIADGYIKTLSTSLINSKVSQNFVMMKLKLAKHFVNLLNRLIKVIETGQPASRILNDDNEKNTMTQDWMKLDIHGIICREMPCNDNNIDTLTYILTGEVVNLIKVKLDNEQAPTMSDFANYISNLPSRFPEVNTRLFLLLASNLLTTCLREISLLGGEGFGAWWIVRCWIDEYLAWSFEVGGFFQDDLQEIVAQQQLNVQLPPPSLSSLPQTQQQNPVIQEETGTQEESLGNIDLLETSFDFDAKTSQPYQQPSHTESLLNFETNIDNLLN